MFLGIDLGTSGIKVLLADNKGKVIASASAGYPLHIPHENWSEQNPEDWYNALLVCIREISGKHNLLEIQGISFSGQMHGLVILDKNDNVIRPAILWNDNRTYHECEYLNNVIGKDKLIEYTGNIAFTGFTAPKLLWLRNNEKSSYDKIDKIMLPKDYLVYKLSGRHASDVSDCSGTLLFDVKNKRWSEDMLSIIGINKEQLPTVYESYEVIGKVRGDFAALTGINENARVIAGGGDQAVGAIGTGTVVNNMVSISLGTSGVVFASSDEYKKVDSGAMHSFCHANGKYHIMGVMLSAAGSIEWWASNILKTKDYKSIDNDITSAKASNLYFLPYIAGERTPINDVNARGVFYGLNLSHTREDMSRAVMEGVCFGILDCLKSIQETGISPECARVVGGGAKSSVWMQMLSDVLGIKLITMETQEGGGIGAIILAMTGCGVFDSVERGSNEIIKISKEYIPNTLKHQYYQSKYLIFKKIYQSLTAVYAESK
jgi:xylulokinase